MFTSQKNTNDAWVEPSQIQEIIKSKIIAIEALKASHPEEDPSMLQASIRAVITDVISLLPQQQPKMDAAINALIAGVVEGVVLPKRSAIARLQSQIQQLQTKIQEEEQKLHVQIDDILREIDLISLSQPVELQTAIQSALTTITEELEISLTNETSQSFKKLNNINPSSLN